jgi:acetylornithine deacetylase/succinyl-diaminopimelate desuccinylase-like protein
MSGAETEVRRNIAGYLMGRRASNLDRLADLIRIPSVSSPAFDSEPVRESAEAVAMLAEEIGLDGVRLIQTDGSLPSVYGSWDKRPGAPTVLLYAHHDVQPPGVVERWTSHPFKPEVRNGRLYGRGASDDKAGVIVHLAALEAWLATMGQLPVNVRLFIDGEEERGNPSLPVLLEQEAAQLKSDVVVVADSMNWRQGQPSITCSLRGVASITVEVRALARPLHSGIWGGAVPDPLMGLSRLLSSLVDDNGEIAVSGFIDDLENVDRFPVAWPTIDGADFKTQAGMAQGVAFSGDPNKHIAERLWARPSLSVLAIDAPAVAGSSNTIQAVARARVSVRLGPGQEPQRAVDRLKAHMITKVPWGLNISFEEGSRHPAWHQAPTGQVFSAAERSFEQAFGTPVTYIGLGGTLPLVGHLTRFMRDVPVLLTGVEDPESRAHGEDESVSIDDLHRACLAEALFLGEITSLGMAAA